jgi:hypothetical protein
MDKLIGGLVLFFIFAAVFQNVTAAHHDSIYNFLVVVLVLTILGGVGIISFLVVKRRPAQKPKQQLTRNEIEVHNKAALAPVAPQARQQQLEIQRRIDEHNAVVGPLETQIQNAKLAIEAQQKATQEFNTDMARHVQSLIQTPRPGLFQVSLHEAHPKAGQLVEQLMSPYYTHPNRGYANKIIKSTYERNIIQVSEGDLTKADFGKGKLIRPSEYKGVDVFNRYLKGTPYQNIFENAVVPIDIPNNIRPEHGVIVGRTGAGKSQLLEKFILADLDQGDPPGIIVIDSKSDNDNPVFREKTLLNRVSRLSVFHPEHGRLKDRLIIVDPVADKPALNMFSYKGELTNEKVNEINESMRYFFSGLLADDLTGQMNTLFVPLLHIVLRLPGATIHDQQSLVRNPLQYPKIVEQLPPGIRRFLVEEFSSKYDGYRPTKQGIITRLQAIINEVSLDAMFSAPTNSFDVAEALRDGKTILVSTNANALKSNSAIFGKYWIAQTLNAGMSRRGNRPIHVYIDECYPYVDDKLGTMLTIIRSYNVGLMLAFQSVGQMGSYTRTILGQTNIKFISGAEKTDAEAFAESYRGMEADEILAVRKRGHTAAFAMQHSELPRAVTVQFPFGELDQRPLMSEADYRLLRARNKARVEGTEKIGVLQRHERGSL